MADDALELTGPIGELTLVELLKSMAIRDRETGTLELTGEGAVRTLFIREGRVLFAASNVLDERLGETLVRAGLVTPKEFFDASARLRPGLRFGWVLTEAGVLAPEELLEGVRAQALTIIDACFRLRGGDYRLKLGPFAASDMVTLQQTSEELLLRGITGLDSFTRVMEAIGSLDLVYAPGPDQARIATRVELNEEQAHLLAQVNGRHSVGKLCEMAYGSHFQTLKILWALDALDLIVRVAGAEAGVEVAAPPPPANPSEILEQANGLFQAVHDALALLDLGGANRAFAEAWGELEMHHPELSGTEFDRSGTLDPDTVLYNLTRARTADPAAASRALVEEILMTLAFKAREIVGPEGEKAVGQTVARQRASLRH